MKHFRCRDDLLDLAVGHPRKAIQRAVLNDDVECLGFFLQFSEEDPRPGWGFRVHGMKGKGMKGREWVYMVVYENRGFVYKSMDKTGQIPWEYWGGDGGLKDGDKPFQYRFRKSLREAMNERKKNTTGSSTKSG